jgi:hypothetical protein
MSIQVRDGVQFSGGAYMSSSTSSEGGGDITLLFTEFVYPTGTPVASNFQDNTANISGTGFTINNANFSGVAMSGLTAQNFAFVAANLPDTTPGGDGEIWTANWSAGSTYNSTPIAIYYSISGPNGFPAIVFWILDPADNTYNTKVAGTFNFPMTLTSGTTTTSFT